MFESFLTLYHTIYKEMKSKHGNQCIVEHIHAHRILVQVCAHTCACKYDIKCKMKIMLRQHGLSEIRCVECVK